MNKQDWIARALEYGFSGFQIRQSTGTSRNMGWFEGKVDSFTTSKLTSTSMRAEKDGRIVSISLEKVDDKNMEDVFAQLASQAAYISETEKDVLVPVIPCDETLSLHTWNRPGMEQVASVLEAVEKKLLSMPYVTMVNSVEYEDAQSKGSIVNSLGVNVEDEGQSQLLVASVTLEKDGELRDGYEVEVVHNLDDFDVDAFAEKLWKKVHRDLGAKSLKSRTCPVIFDNKTMTTLFGCFKSAFYGSLIAKGISPLAGKLNEQVFSNLITVIDDPRNQNALTLQNYDDEGHPTYEKVIVNHGVFETILHNTKSALKMNAESTGNGFAAGAGSTDVSSWNMYIVPGKDSLEQLEQKMENGVVITELNGMHAGVDFVSGNFSLQARGYLVENGQYARPLTLFTVAGNFFEMMKEVTAVGDDLDWSYKSLACPSILFKQASIAGQD